MQQLRDPILQDLILLAGRHPGLNPDQKTRLMLGLGQLDDELARLRVLEATARAETDLRKGGKR